MIIERDPDRYETKVENGCYSLVKIPYEEYLKIKRKKEIKKLKAQVIQGIIAKKELEEMER